MTILRFKKGCTQHGKKSAGFTLVELIVAVGLFAIVMTLATGAYLVMISANRQTQGLATGINNLSFVLDSMTTAMRTGSAYCGNTALTCGTTFSYRDQKNNYVEYGLVGGVIESCISPTAYCSPNTPLTESRVTVSNLTFVPSGTTRGDTSQPYTTIYVTGTVTVGPGKTQNFSIESSVIMRGSDI